MKSVMLSIHPKWCELIANGKKMVEVRKTKPKIETPFKCYIYCTKEFYRKGDGYFQGKCCGKVIGEFVCDKVDRMVHCGSCNSDVKLRFADSSYYTEIAKEYLFKCQLTYSDLEKYFNGGDLYGWHISDLVIYDEPKMLEDFGLKRPPQSWCYVEELEE